MSEAAPIDYTMFLSNIKEVCIIMQSIKLRYEVGRPAAVVGASAFIFGETMVKMDKLLKPKLL